MKFTIYRSDDGTNWEYHSEYDNIEQGTGLHNLKNIQWEDNEWKFKGSYTLT